jgi:hypothetical protein
LHASGQSANLKLGLLPIELRRTVQQARSSRPPGKQLSFLR